MTRSCGSASAPGCAAAATTSWPRRADGPWRSAAAPGRISPTTRTTSVASCAPSPHRRAATAPHRVPRLEAVMSRSVPRLAISVMPLENRLDVIRRLARCAERLDYEAYLVPETWSYDAHALLAAIARDTERITLGPAVVNS